MLSVRFWGRSHFVEPNCYFYHLDKRELPHSKTILFELNNSEFIHLGDHLFFLPLIKSLLNFDFQVEVSCSPQIFALFQRLGLPVVQTPQYQDYDVIISRFELIPQLSRFRSVLVHVSQNLKRPICSQLLNDFSDFFQKQLRTDLDFTTFQNANILEKLGLPKNKKLVLINLYCNSSSYLITKDKQLALKQQVEIYASKQDYGLVLVGTKEDKLKDPNPISGAFDLIDLRGQTDVIELFELVSAPEVELYIGFDAFVMHVFSLLGKRSLVKFRGRLTQKQSEMLSKYHVNLFDDHQYVTLI